MDLLHSLHGRLPLRTVLRFVLCLGVVVSVVLALIYITGRTEDPEPFVDIYHLSPGNSRETELSLDLRDRLRFAVATMVSAEATFSTYHRFVQRISRDVGMREGFVVRPSYEHVRMDLEQGRLDVALVCTGTYLYGMESRRIRLLVQPEFTEGNTYRSLLIVPAGSRVRRWEDLRGKVMAFTDHESFTGSLLPSALLADAGLVPAAFFRKIVYTSNHDRSILAVSSNVVDAAAVNSLVWQSNLYHLPVLRKMARIIWQSDVFGSPPVVVPEGLDPDLEERLRRALLTLHRDEEGRRILSEIGIKRFVPPDPEAYDSAIALFKRYKRQSGKP